MSHTSQRDSLGSPEANALAFVALLMGARLYVPCNGGNDEAGGHGWKIGAHAA
jgi:hypothetical protein